MCTVAGENFLAVHYFGIMLLLLLLLPLLLRLAAAAGVLPTCLVRLQHPHFTAMRLPEQLLGCESRYRFGLFKGELFGLEIPMVIATDFYNPFLQCFLSRLSKLMYL